MTIEETIKVLSNERACVMRNTAGACDRKCADCDLVLPDEQVISAYRMAVNILRAQQEAEKNEPLTMDQLWKMNGQPVYVVGEPGGCIDGWQLVMIGRFDVDVIFFTSYTGHRVELNEADKDIRAIYRRPPAGGTA